MNLFRMIIPVFPEVNVFSHQAKRTTALGPLMIATAINKMPEWKVEVIDENNYEGGLPNHRILQEDRPATVVGFYCGLTSTIRRVWELAEFYQNNEVLTIAGGWHAHYCPEETLDHNIDVVAHGDGEETIRELLNAFPDFGLMSKVPGISFRSQKSGENVQRNGLKLRLVADLNTLPSPDFGLLRKANIKVYPIGRIRGCSQGCEFCSVKGRPRWASPEHLFNTVTYLVETRKAKRFFIVDDRLEGDREGTKRFFELIAKKYGNRLRFTVQARLELAEDVELMEAMSSAGVHVVCIGVESPIDDDLRAMKKGYTSEKMLDWIKTIRRYFRTHCMFIAGYPQKISGRQVSPDQIVRSFRGFARRSKTDTIQVMLPGPGVGTGLRRRLEKEGRLFPLDVVSWDKYDGGYVCFQPKDMSVEELQKIPLRIMGRFYSPVIFMRVIFRILMFPSHCFLKGWKHWLRMWSRDLTCAGGHILLRRRKGRENADDHVRRIKTYQQQRRE